MLTGCRKITSLGLIGCMIFGFIAPAFAAVAPTFDAQESVANYDTQDTQTAVTTVTQASVAEVKASQTLTVVSLPANNTSITIGQCVVTFKSNPSTTSIDELDCFDDVATIDIETSPGNNARTPATI